MAAIEQDAKGANEQSVRDLARPFDFSLLGVASAEPSPHGDYLRRWLADRRHGEMDYLARNVAARVDPRKLLDGARTVICVADRYFDDDNAANAPGDRVQNAGTGDATGPFETSHSGRIARYAWSDDYHRIIKRRLHQLADALRQRWPEHSYKSAVDTAPILEREHAVRAGLGWIGKHTLLIHPSAGSWLLLGQIITTLPVTTTADVAPIADHCGTCTRCIDACPTACIEPYRLDAKRCISYLTIEHRGLIDPDLHESMGDWVAGCDICQEVCPFNRQRNKGVASRLPTCSAQTTPDPSSPVESRSASDEGRSRSEAPTHPDGSAAKAIACHSAYAPRPPAPRMDLLDVLGWCEQDRRAAFQRSALKRIKLDQIKRNALIAAGNTPHSENHMILQRRIRAIIADPETSDLVRKTARQVMADPGAQHESSG